MPIKLDWRFTLLDDIAQVRLKVLLDFARQAEGQFDDAMKAWNEEVTGLTEEQEEMMGDYLIERRDNIESLLDRGYTLGILGLYTFLERFLNEVVGHLRTGGASILPSKKGFNLYQLRRAWLEIDPALLKRIHQLDIPNISTSYDTTAIVEDFKLHLKAVSDYQRMSASIRGIEAAATVLEKHGINSTVESMAD